MKTTKSYLAGLGTTAVLIASVVTLMAIGSGLVGFDGHELGGGSSPLERVVVGDGAHGKRAESRRERAVAAGQPVVAGAERRRLSSRRRRAERTGVVGGRRDAAARRTPRRRSAGHGGVPVRAYVLSGGAAAERGPGGRRGERPESGERPERSAGGAVPRSSPGGGLPVPAPIERAQEDLHDSLPSGLRR